MQMKQVIFVGSLAALVAAAAPALAKNSQTQKTDEQVSSSSCNAYQQAPDGSWTPLPCQAHGAGTQTEQRPVAANGNTAQR